MLKGLLSSSKKRKNYSILSILFFISAISFSLLTSYPASAIGSWSTDGTGDNYISMSYSIYGGCLWDSYSLNNGTNVSSVYLGTNAVSNTTSSSDLYNCGYRYIDGHQNYYRRSSDFSRTLTINQGTTTSDTYASTGGSTNLITGSYNSDFNNFDYDLFNDVENIVFLISNSATTSSPAYSVPAEPEDATTWGYVFYLFSFDVPESTAFSGLQFGLSSTEYLSSNGGAWTISEARDYMNDTIITWCGDFSAYSSSFPDYFSSLTFSSTSGYVKCFIGGAYPMSGTANGIVPYNGRKFSFTAKDAKSYNRSYYTTTNGVVLPKYGYPWNGVFRSRSYKQMGAKYDDGLKFINPAFNVVWCTTGDECADFEQKNYQLQTNNNASVGSSNSSGGYSNTVQEEIDYNESQINNATNNWGVLDTTFGVPWIFSGWFNLFIDNDCVDIPTIQSLIHSEESRICSPWVGTPVRSLLTPVITVVSSMLLFGFVVRWLKHGSSSEVS